MDQVNFPSPGGFGGQTASLLTSTCFHTTISAYSDAVYRYEEPGGQRPLHLMQVQVGNLLFMV